MPEAAAPTSKLKEGWAFQVSVAIGPPTKLPPSRTDARLILPQGRKGQQCSTSFGAPTVSP